MCECGCTSNDDRYSLPAPKRAIYVVTLSKACVYCDAPSGVTIERIDPGTTLYDEYKAGEFMNGPLVLEDWPDSKGAAIVCGLLKHEFVKAMTPHLVGVSSEEMGENGVIDEDGADAIAEEMYRDAQIRPHLATNPCTA